MTAGAGPVFNERAWGIQVITQINLWLAGDMAGHPVRRAGGEYGAAAAGESTLFSDVLLFGDAKERLILQGWELKTPETPVDDSALLANAIAKAERMRTGSFLVWNGRTAVLHESAPDGRWPETARWTALEVDSRASLAANPEAWKRTLREILEHLARHFAAGGGLGRPDAQAQLDWLAGRALEAFREPVLADLKRRHAGSRKFRAALGAWWLGVQDEHPRASGGPETALEVKADEIACHWVFRVLFAHWMKTVERDAWGVDRLVPGMSQADAEAFFDGLSDRHDYAHLLHSRGDLPGLSDEAWRVVVAFNELLSRVRLSEIGQAELHGLLRGLGEKERRKAFGQFATPRRLADLLARLVLDDAENDVVLDPCCGTGTLARAVVDARMRLGVSAGRCLQTTWASDRFRGPLQFATLAMSSAGNSREVVRVFQSDALGLECGMPIEFRDPMTGETRREPLPRFTAILSNPPYIRFEHWRDNYAAGDGALGTALRLAENLRSDFLVPVVLHLADLLEDGGTLGLVLPNAWLGTDWARAFRAELARRFRILHVAGSLAGRWFVEAKVVANLVVLQKKRPGEADGEGRTVFSLAKRPLEAWTDADVDGLAARMMAPADGRDDALASVCPQTSGAIAMLDEMGLSWTAGFVPLDWLEEIRAKLVPASRFFEIARGERRGWDSLFYPGEADARGIEPEFLAPVVKTASTVERLVAEPDGVAFCCGLPAEELQRTGRSGALAWIRRFERETNGTGRPLPEVLARTGRQWYEMAPETKADLAVSMNPGERLFFMRMENPTFVNQRLVRLTRKPGAPAAELCQALLCSLAGCFFLEALGFGRGEGVLDLNATKLRNGLPMWNPGIIAPDAAATILKAFRRLARRPVRPFSDECRSPDRQTFERAVLEAVGCAHLHDRILAATSHLHEIRLAPVRGGRPRYP